MKSINNHITAIRTTLELLFQGRFLAYFIPGAVITIVYFFVINVMQSYEEALDLSTDYSWLDWFTNFLENSVKGVFSIFGFLFEQLYIFIVLTLLSPFNTSLAEKLDSKLTGAEFKFDLLRFINDMIRMIFVVFVILILEGLFILIYNMLSWLLGLGALDPIVHFLIAAFFFGFSFYDFALERYAKGVGSSISYAFENILSMILTGGIFLAIYQIPFIGIPISVVLAVMISTVVYLYNEKILPKAKEVIKTDTDE